MQDTKHNPIALGRHHDEVPLDDPVPEFLQKKTGVDSNRGKQNQAEIQKINQNDRPRMAPINEEDKRDQKPKEQSQPAAAAPQQQLQQQPLQVPEKQLQPQSPPPPKNEALPNEALKAKVLKNEVPKNEVPKNEALKNEAPKEKALKDRPLENPKQMPLQADKNPAQEGEGAKKPTKEQWEEKRPAKDLFADQPKTDQWKEDPENAFANELATHASAEKPAVETDPFERMHDG